MSHDRLGLIDDYGDPCDGEALVFPNGILFSTTSNFSHVLSLSDVSSKSEDFVSLAAGLSPSLLQTREQRLRQLADLLLDVWDSTMESVRDIPRAYLPPGRKESSADEDDDDDISLSPGQLDNGKYLGALGSAVVSQISSAVSSAAAAVAGRWTKPPSPE
ncbi:unnamed protein product [Dicrocoelium dendriticum]|nr:unnamed protein product [Dicrocoelium dendriticum]